MGFHVTQALTGHMMPSGTNSLRVTKQSHVIMAQSAEIRQSIQYFGA